MNEDFSQGVLDRIEKEHVRPQPRWIIIASRWLMYAILILSIAFAAMLFSLLMFAVFHIDPRVIRSSGFGPMIRMLLNYVPLLWIGLFIIFCVVELLVIRHTAHAYRHSLTKLIGFVILGAALLGAGLYALRLPERVERTMQRRLPPPMQPWMMRREPPPRLRLPIPREIELPRPRPPLPPLDIRIK